MVHTFYGALQCLGFAGSNSTAEGRKHRKRKKERSGYKEYEETEREERKKEIKGNCLVSKTNPKWPTTPVNWASWLCTNEHEMK